MIKDKLYIPLSVIEEARRIIASGEGDCILIKDSKIIEVEKGRGISPLMNLYINKRDNMEGSVVVDKVVGKAAAMLCVCAKVKAVFAELISQPASEYLLEKKILRSWAKLSANIKNRQKDGICPMEFSVLDEDDPHDGLNKLCTVFEKIKKSENIKEL